MPTHAPDWRGLYNAKHLQLMALAEDMSDYCCVLYKVRMSRCDVM